MNAQASSTPANITTSSADRFGSSIAILTSLMTVLTFAIAILTPPLSGPLCVGSCFEYPYTDITARFPRDYFWMFPAMVLTVLYLVLVVCIHQYAASDKKVFSQVGLSLALIAAAVLIVDYFVQVSVIQPSLLNGETDGIALWTQFNSHGLFIALEEIGYLLMSLSFLFLAPVFSGRNGVERAIRWLFTLSFVLIILSLGFLSVQYGVYREYRFEIISLSIDWIVLIVSGVLLSVLFRRSTSMSV